MNLILGRIYVILVSVNGCFAFRNKKGFFFVGVEGKRSFLIAVRFGPLRYYRLMYSSLKKTTFQKLHELVKELSPCA